MTSYLTHTLLCSGAIDNRKCLKRLEILVPQPSGGATTESPGQFTRRFVGSEAHEKGWRGTRDEYERIQWLCDYRWHDNDTQDSEAS